MRTLLVIVSLIFISYYPLYAQPSASQQWISTGTVQALLQAGGPLISDFRIPGPNGGTTVSGLHDLMFWMGGIDPGANLSLAIQQPDTAQSSFVSGFRGLPSSARVWKVTKAEIEQHLADYADNGHIDNPIPAIFAWPGWKNPYSLQYNGFDIENVTPVVSASFENLWNGSSYAYNPAEGAYPALPSFFFNQDRHPPDEIVYTPFYERYIQIVPGWPYTIHEVKVDCSLLLFSYQCDDNAVLDHTIFGCLGIYFNDTIRLDSVSAGFLIDGDIGNPDDDYLGSLFEGWSAYFYNAYALDSIFGYHPPLVAFEFRSGILNTFGIETGVNSLMPFHSDSAQVPAGMKPPQTPFEYYRNLTGSWRDGTPLSASGTGYNPGNPGLPRITYAFPGNPTVPGEWSEMSQGNIPGNRRALMSNGPITLKPGFSNKISFRIHYVPDAGSLEQTLDAFAGEIQSEFLLLDADIFPPDINPFDTLPCFGLVSTFNPGMVPISMYPNPAHNWVQIDSEEHMLESVALYDLLGRAVSVPVEKQGNGLRVRTEALPAGLYMMLGKTQEGLRFGGKLLVR